MNVGGAQASNPHVSWASLLAARAHLSSRPHVRDKGVPPGVARRWLEDGAVLTRAEERYMTDGGKGIDKDSKCRQEDKES